MSIKFLDDFYSKNSILYHTDDSYSPAITYVLDGIIKNLLDLADECANFEK